MHTVPELRAAGGLGRTETGGHRNLGHPKPHIKFEVSLGYMKFSFIKQTNKQK